MKALTRLIIFLLLFAAACSTLEKAPEIYRIGRDPSFYPLNLMGKEVNLLAFSDELLIEIGKIENFQVEFYASSAYGIRQGLKQGIYDAAITDETPTSMTESRFEYSMPFFLLGPVLMVSIDSNVSKLEDLNDKIVGIPSNSPLTYRTKLFPDVIFKTYDNILIAMDQLADDKIDGVIIDAFKAYTLTRSFYKGRVKVATSPLNQEGFRMMTILNEKSNDFIDRFNDGLKQVVENGTYVRLLQKWDLFDSEVTPKTSPDKVPEENTIPDTQPIGSED